MSRLSEWILLNIEALLQPWEDNAEELLPDKSATKAERRDHAKAMLVSICQELNLSDLDELLLFDRAIEQAFLDSIESYTKEKEKQERSFVSMLSGSPDP